MTDGVDLTFGPERLLAVNALGPFIDDRANVTVERATVEVALDEVLLQLRPDPLQDEP